jgi:hypothetical protein
MLVKKEVKMSRIIIIFSILLIIASACNPSKYCPKHGYFEQIGIDTFYKERIVERERMIEIPVASDSGYLRAWIECQKNKPVITQVIDYKPGAKVKPSVTISGNVLTSKCIVDSAKVYTLLKERDTIRESRTTQTIVKTIRQPKSIVVFLAWSGGMAWLILLIFIVIKYGWPLIRKMIFKV